MDRILGSIISDYDLYNIVEAGIAILLMIIVYLGIQICLKWKYMKRGGETMSKINFTRSAIFIFMAGFFMIVHELLEGLEENAPDFVTYEFLELLALIGLSLFFYEWLRVLKSIKSIDKKMDGDLLYKCGHGAEPVIMNTTVETLVTYMQWANGERNLCLECWLKKRKELHGDMKPKYVKKTVVVVVEVPTCPKCGEELEEEKDSDARALYHLKCSCGYKY